MSAPTIDPVSDFIIRHDLVSWFWHGLSVLTIAHARKIMAALKRLLLDGIHSFEEVFGSTCDCVARCSAKLNRCRKKPPR